MANRSDFHSVLAELAHEDRRRREMERVTREMAVTLGLSVLYPLGVVAVVVGLAELLW